MHFAKTWVKYWWLEVHYIEFDGTFKKNCANEVNNLPKIYN